MILRVTNLTVPDSAYRRDNSLVTIGASVNVAVPVSRGYRSRLRVTRLFQGDETHAGHS